MSQRDFSRLCAPRSLVIIGGGAWGESLLWQCQEFGYQGHIWIVHPKRDEIGGIKTFKSLCELPHAPDAAFIGVNRRTTIDIVAQLAAMGCGGAVCFASGFAEALTEYPDGAELQQQLVQIAGQMPILGPNCYGLINALERCILWPDLHGVQPCASGVAILTQSSNIAINVSMQQRGLPVAMMVTLGNQAQTSLCDMAEWLLNDPRITALGLYIEGIDDPKRWCDLAAKAHQLGKSVIALKVGTSQQAQSATVSHTASLAGSSAGAKALLQRLGIAQVDDLPTLLEALKIAHVHGWLDGQKLASMSCSGGEASLIADIATAQGLEFPALAKNVDAALHDALGDAVKRANPLDYHTYIWGDEAALTQTFAAMFQGEWSLVILIIDFPRRGDVQAWYDAISAFDAARNNIPAVILASLPENLPEEAAKAALQRGIIPLVDFASASAAIRAMQRPTPNLTPPVIGKTGKARTLSEAQAKQYLRPFDLAIPNSIHAVDQAELYHRSQSLRFPLVLKGQGFAHKTEAGAVILGLHNPDDVANVAATMNAESYLLEEMVDDSICELLVGVVNDPAHGYVLTIGAGGQDTELLQDTASVSLPANNASLETAIQSLRIAPKLHGFRGKPAIAYDKLLLCLQTIQKMVLAADGTIEEAEINPVLCTPTEAWVADALIRLRDPL